jgi:rare lipoprotein A
VVSLLAQISITTGEMMKSRSLLGVLAAALLAAAVLVPTQTFAADAEAGNVAYYGQKFAGRKTANGERFNPQALTMAHKTLPFGSLVKVTNEKNNRSVVVRVNDRGPTTDGRVGDVSLAAARKLKMVRSGVVSAKLEVVGQAKARGRTKKAA